MLRSFIYGKESDIMRDSFIYNTVSGLVNAAQSVFILMVLSRLLGDYDAGVFNIAWAVGNLMLNVGKFGMRGVQVTDVTHRYSFRTYLNSRLISTAVMIAVSLAYVLHSAVTIGYEPSKTIIIILVCLLKAIDSIEDIYQSQQQLNGRLDVAGKCYTVRLTVTVISYIALLLIFRNLLVATAVTLVISVISAVYLLHMTAPVARDNDNVTSDSVLSLFIECFLLFVATFLAFYMINAPKFAIDALLSPEAQADYGYISMPVFIIGMVSTFIYNPIIKGMADNYSSGNMKLFYKEIIRQMLYLAILILVIMAGTYLLGIPLLSVFFHKDLSAYKAGLLVLMAGGSLHAYSNLVRAVLTLIRKQWWVMAAYCAASVFEFRLAGYFISKDGVYGGCKVFLYSMLSLSVIITVGMMICIRKKPASTDVMKEGKT